MDITEIIARRFVLSIDVPRDMKDIYVYGLRLIIADIINFSLILIFGAFLKCMVKAVIFLLMLLFVRRFTGGFHAGSFAVCRLSMIISFFSVLAVSHLQSGFIYGEEIAIVVCFFSVLVVFFTAPIEHRNKPLNKEQRKSNRKKAIISSVVSSTLSSVLCFMGFPEGVFVSNTLLLIVILMFVGLIIKKGEKNNA